MELQFKKRELRCLARAARDVQNQELTQELRLSDGMPDIGRVLSSWGQMILRAKEWRGDTVTLTGGVMVWVLYAPEDGSEPRCIDGWIPFQLRWMVTDPGQEGPVRISPLIRFVDSRTVSARKFMVRVGAAAMAEALYPSEFAVYSPEEIPDSIQILRRTYPVRLPREAGEKTFTLDEDLTVGSVKPEKLLSYTVHPEMTECRVNGNKILFRGNANLHLVYRCGEGRIRTWDWELPFSQFADLERSYGPDAGGDVRMGTTSLELDLNEGGQLRLKCGLVGQYLVDDRELVDVVEDAYSPDSMVTPRMETLRIPALLEQKQHSVDADQELHHQAKEIADVTFFPDFPQQRRTGDEIQWELPGIFQVLYYGEDGSLQSSTARWNGQWQMSADQDSELSAALNAVRQPKAGVTPDGIRVNGNMSVILQTQSQQGIPMATGLTVEQSEQTDSGRPSLILLRAGEESLWEIAKAAGSTMDAIREANDLEQEPTPGRILLIPIS